MSHAYSEPNSWALKNHDLTIVSGFQSGVDRSSAAWAIRKGLPHGGWCPKGRRAEDGTIPACYHCEETATSNYRERTEKNIVCSHGTVIFTIKERLSGGSKLTAKLAKKHQKPSLHLHKGIPNPAAALAEFLQSNKISRLNVAGPRASKEPLIGHFVTGTLDQAYALLPS